MKTFTSTSAPALTLSLTSTLVLVLTLIIILTLTITLALSSIAQAKDFGKAGQTFEIVEEGFIEMIKRKLESIDIDKERIKMQGVARSRVDNPTALIGITKATKTREFHFDPSIVVEEDIVLPDGKVLHKAGTRVNPLDYLNLDRRMIFIDGRDSIQVEWLKEELAAFNEHDEERAEENRRNDNPVSIPTIVNRVILTGGKIMELQKELNHELYFDQAGELTSKFGIEAVPAIAVQEGRFIRIKQIAIEDNYNQK